MDIFSPVQVLTGVGACSKYMYYITKWIWPTSPTKSEMAEKRLLADLNGKYKLGWIKLGNNRAINTLFIPAKNPKRTVLFLHGYGVGLAYFFKSYSQFAKLADEGTNIVAIDWLGMGRSSRNKITGKTVEEVESYFIDSLEEWREKMEIDKMVLFGHSLGGYLGTAYSIKYPNRVEKLILCSPAGFPERSNTARKLPWWVSFLWERSFTPQGIVRFLGPFGPKLLSGYTQRRFKHLEESDLSRLHDYLYQISADYGAGEYAISHFFLPGAYAKKPLVNRFHEVKAPTRFIYGTYDWMDKNGAYDAIKKHPNPSLHKVYTSDGGHHMYLDNHMAFNELMEGILRE